MARLLLGLGFQGDDGDEGAGALVWGGVALVGGELNHLRIVVKKSASEGIKDGTAEFVDVPFLLGG
jgi:hypothetical protein